MRSTVSQRWSMVLAMTPLATIVLPSPTSSATRKTSDRIVVLPQPPVHVLDRGTLEVLETGQLALDVGAFDHVVSPL
jgi:hypothetical protein